MMMTTTAENMQWHQVTDRSNHSSSSPAAAAAATSIAT